MKKLKIIFVIFICLILFAGCGVSGQTEIFNVNELKLDKDNLYIKVGESAELNAQVFPFNAHNQQVYWNSSNNSIAVVDANGKVTAKKTGQAEITATSVDGGYNSKCKVDVMENIMKDYMGDKNTQINNVNKIKSINENVSGEENGTSNLYNFNELFNSINEIFERQQQFFNTLIEQFESEEYLKDLQVVEQKEEEQTMQDGTTVKIKKVVYKNK